jgi:carboxypeptidase family protein/TonB-dependent receptor-like protein
VKKIGLCFGVLTVLTLLPVRVFCQSSPQSNPVPASEGESAAATTKVAGVVRTALNAAVPGAMVRVVHLPSGRSWASWTDDDGKFSFQGLPAGSYRLEARQLGFGRSQVEMNFTGGASEEAQLTLHVEVSSPAVQETKPAPGVQATLAGTSPAPEKTGGKGAAEESTSLPASKEPKSAGRVSVPGAIIPKASSGSKKSKKEAPLSATSAVPGSDLSASLDETPSSDALSMSGTVNRAATLGGAGSFGSSTGFVGAGSASASSAAGDGSFPLAGQSADPTGSPKASKVSKGVQSLTGKHKKAKQAEASSDATDFGQGIEELWAQQRVSRLTANQMHLSLTNRFEDGAWDARPYNITGPVSIKLNNYTNIFDMRLGGPLSIPHVFESRQRTFFFLSTQINRATQPLDNFATVPTLSERNGDFSGLGTQLYDPASNIAGPRALLGTSIPQSRMDQAALRILPFIPLPNLPGLVDNFHLQSSLHVKNSLVNARVLHTISSHLNVSAAYSASVTNMENPHDFPQYTNLTKGLGQSATLTLNQNWTSRLLNSTKLNWSRNVNDGLSGFAQTTNIMAALGIQGVSQAPIDWGLPNIHFTNYGEWHDFPAVLQRNQTLRLMDNLSYALPKHTLHAGAEIRWMQVNADSNSSPRGDFQFTGLMTSQLDAQGIPVPGTGFDFADFLLGYPQNAQVGYGLGGTYTNFRSRAYNFYFQDDWRVHPRFAINFGVRYELTTPPVELYNRIANLVFNPNLTAVATVLPGDVNPFTGQTTPRGIVKTNWNNWGPRIGIAWRPPSKLPFVLRAGYGIFYNESVYNRLAASLAIQPPFAHAQILETSTANVLRLENSFLTPTVGQIPNTMGVDPNYRVGYAQLWNLSLESQVTPSLVVELDYTGTKGTALDLFRAPNRALPGSPLSTDLNRRIPYASGFAYDNSGAFSIYHGFQLVVRRQTSHGLIVQGTYTYGKSMDDAGSINGSAPVVVQDENNIAAERGLSDFDMRHQLRGSFSYDLPFGPTRRWLHSGWVSSLFRDLKVSGLGTILSGSPFTARVLGSAADNTGTGVNLSQRADQIGDPSLPGSQQTPLQFFNTAAFVVPPPGQFGDAARNTIPGPGRLSFDFSLDRKFKFGEGTRREFEWRWEVVNATNTASFIGLNTVVNSSIFGQVGSAHTMRTMDLMLKATF